MKPTRRTILAGLFGTLVAKLLPKQRELPVNEINDLVFLRSVDEVNLAPLPKASDDLTLVLKIYAPNLGRPAFTHDLLTPSVKLVVDQMKASELNRACLPHLHS